MVGEEVERAAAGTGVLSNERSVLALIEKRAGFLPGPRRGEILHTILDNLDNLGNLPLGEHHLRRQPLVAPHPGVVAKQNPFRSERGGDSRNDVRARGLEPCRQQLRDDPRPVAVDDERGQAVTFGVHDAPGARADAVAATGCGGNALRPPRRIDGFFAAGEQPQPDLGVRRVERLAEELAFAVGDGDDAGLLVGFLSDVAPIDPGVSLFPSFRAPSSNLDGCGRPAVRPSDRHRSGRRTAAPRRYICLRALCGWVV